MSTALALLKTPSFGLGFYISFLEFHPELLEISSTCNPLMLLKEEGMGP